MEVALLTIGDELLAGDIEHSNATWIPSRLTERGATVPRILVIPDDRELIARTVEDYADKFDATIVTGGLGDTPDDVTMDAVADAFDRPLAIDERARADVEKRLEVVREEYPDIELDVDTEASIPEGSRALINDPGLAPGCVVENVYVLPGIPEEMRSMFEKVQEEFGGDVDSRTFYTP